MNPKDLEECERISDASERVPGVILEIEVHYLSLVIFMEVRETLEFYVNIGFISSCNGITSEVLFWPKNEETMNFVVLKGKMPLCCLEVGLKGFCIFFSSGTVKLYITEYTRYVF